MARHRTLLVLALTAAGAVGGGAPGGKGLSPDEIRRVTAGLGGKYHNGSAAELTDGLEANGTVYFARPYTVRVDSGDCPCRRRSIKYCTVYRRPAVLEGQCYWTSHHVRSMSVRDPLISRTNRLVCRVYGDVACRGVGVEITFVDNTECKVARYAQEAEAKWRSFTCFHDYRDSEWGGAPPPPPPWLMGPDDRPPSDAGRWTKQPPKE
ncbi:hypothetical protein CDD83_3772 [Cordyceps sp. RAO-2017]|nr:hypothetical protein CDD83_3772 [Cordyceps sp. RAO-2017]